MIQITVLIATLLTFFQASDKIQTSNGDLEIIPILHGTFAMKWDGKTIYVDPYGGGEKFEGMDDASIILITDIHGDHLNTKTLQELNTSQSIFVVPQAVKDMMGDIKGKETIVLANGEMKEVLGIEIEAFPMYNLPETEDSRHPKGRGNGYVLTIGGKRILVSGDTEDTPELRAMKDIDVAFVCMNLPYTMDINQAADAVLAFKPKIVYPFHYRGGGGKYSDVEAFKELVNAKDSNIEVRLRDWYN